MKLTKSGFTLVELMIVIAIIGILAAALFPAMSGYLSRSRDTARVSHVGQIVTAATTLYNDAESYDTLITSTNCVNSGAINKYMGGRTPTDRTPSTHCTLTNGTYGAGTGTINSSPAVAISAVLENSGMGNTGSLTGLQGSAGALDAVPTYTKNSGTGYVIAR